MAGTPRCVPAPGPSQPCSDRPPGVCPAEAPLTDPVALVSCPLAVSVRVSLRLPTAALLLPALFPPPDRSLGSLGPSSARGGAGGWRPGPSAPLRPRAPAARRRERVLDVAHAALPAHVREHAGLLPLLLRLRLPAGGRRQALRRYEGPPPARPRPGLSCPPLRAGTPLSRGLAGCAVRTPRGGSFPACGAGSPASAPCQALVLATTAVPWGLGRELSERDRRQARSRSAPGDAVRPCAVQADQSWLSRSQQPRCLSRINPAGFYMLLGLGG